MAQAAPAGASPAAAAAAPAPAGSYVDVPHSQIRRITAARLLESKTTIPHYYLSMEVQVCACAFCPVLGSPYWVTLLLLPMLEYVNGTVHSHVFGDQHGVWVLCGKDGGVREQSHGRHQISRTFNAGTGGDEATGLVALQQ